jgi:hypothetical protein
LVDISMDVSTSENPDMSLSGCDCFAARLLVRSDDPPSHDGVSEQIEIPRSRLRGTWSRSPLPVPSVSLPSPGSKRVGAVRSESQCMTVACDNLGRLLPVLGYHT